MTLVESLVPLGEPNSMALLEAIGSGICEMEDIHQVTTCLRTFFPEDVYSLLFS